MLLAGTFYWFITGLLVGLCIGLLVSRLIYFTWVLALLSWSRTPFCVRLLNVCTELHVCQALSLSP